MAQDVHSRVAISTTLVADDESGVRKSGHGCSGPSIERSLYQLSICHFLCPARARGNGPLSGAVILHDGFLGINFNVRCPEMTSADVSVVKN